MTFDRGYTCVTRYQLLCVVLHRLAHREGTAVLFLVNLTFTDEEIAEIGGILEQWGLFDSVRTYNERGVWDRLARETVGTAVRAKAGARFEPHLMPQVQQLVLDHFRDVVGESAEGSTEWYVAGDQYSLGLALTFSGTPYIQFEEHLGGYEQPELFRNTLAKLNAYQYKIYELLADDRKICVRGHVVDSLTVPASAEAAPVEELGIRVTLDAMPREELEVIFRMFGYTPGEEPDDSGDAALLITQPFARWRFLEWGQQKELYRHLVDYFAPHAKLIVKPHPQDNLTPYALWFPAARVVSPSVPMELVLTSIKPSVAITVGSTAIFPLRSTETDTVFLGQGFEQVYKQIPRIFALATVLGWLGIREVACSDAIPRDALQAFMGTNAVVTSEIQGCPALVHWSTEPSPSSVDSHDVVASFTPMVMPDAGVSEFRVVVRRQQRSRPYATQSLVYLYSRDANRFDDVKGMTLERTLPNLSEDLTVVFPVDGDTMFLQAQVASLEARVSGLTERLREIETAPNKRWFALNRR